MNWPTTTNAKAVAHSGHDQSKATTTTCWEGTRQVVKVSCVKSKASTWCVCVPRERGRRAESEKAVLTASFKTCNVDAGTPMTLLKQLQTRCNVCLAVRIT